MARAIMLLAFSVPLLCKVTSGADWKFNQTATGNGTNADDGFSETYQQIIVDEAGSQSNKLEAAADASGVDESNADVNNTLFSEDIQENYMASAGGLGNGNASNATGLSSITINDDGTSQLESEASGKAVGTGETNGESSVEAVHTIGTSKSGVAGESLANTTAPEPGSVVSSALSETSMTALKEENGEYSGSGSADAESIATGSSESSAMTGLEHFNHSDTSTMIGGRGFAGVEGESANSTASAGVQVNTTELMQSGIADGKATFKAESDEYEGASGLASAGASDGVYGLELDGNSYTDGSAEKKIEAVLEAEVMEGYASGNGTAEQSIHADGDAYGYNAVSISALDLDGQHAVSASSTTDMDGNKAAVDSEADIKYNEVEGGMAHLNSAGNATAINGSAELSIDSSVWVQTHNSTYANTAAHESSSKAEGAQADVMGVSWSNITEAGNNGGVISNSDASNTDASVSTTTGVNATFINNNGAEIDLAAGTNSVAEGEETAILSTSKIDHASTDVYSLESETHSQASGAGTTAVQTNGYFSFPGRKR